MAVMQVLRYQSDVFILCKNGNINYEIKYKVVDDQAPIIITAPTQVTLYNTTEKSPCDSFVFVDNYDKEPTCICN